MDHNAISDRIKEWLNNEGWGCNSNDNNSVLYLSLRSAQTDLSANIQIRTYDDGWYRAYAIWPDEIYADMKPLIHYVALKSSENLEYGRLKASYDDKTLYYVTDIYINDISELTDDVLHETVTVTALRLTETYGPDISEIISDS